jgi:signal transduction histidine kinase/ABC-type multidrug transport system ATPase subunit
MVRGLSLTLGRRLILDSVDLDLRPGEIVAVVGENGAGKTTLVRCLAGELRPDTGIVDTAGGPPTVGVVWQDLALCDHLDVVANIWLGREPGWLDEARLEADTGRLLAGFGIDLPELRRPVGTLSGGERQLVAVARALAGRPDVCVLDEPTAALSLSQTRTVDAILRAFRTRGGAALLVTHEPEAVSALADRIVVLRRGRVVATPSAGELHPDDLLAVMAGAEVETTARRQLRRLRDLVDQLGQDQASAALPVVVSAAGAALGQERLCVHLLDEPVDGPPHLRSAAAVGLSADFAEAVADLPVGPRGGPVGLAAATRAPAVVEYLGDGAWPDIAAVAGADGIAAAWAVPLVGRRGVLGVLSGFDTVPGALSEDRLALVSLYAAQAATAVESEALQQEIAQRSAAERSSRLAREFLSRLSHELRTPLTAIRGYASSLCQPDVSFDGATTERFLATIASESARLARLVSDLLDATALDSGALRLRCDWCDVGGIVRAALAAVPGGESVAVEAPTELPTVWGDHDRLCQVVVNLVENALRHTPEGTEVHLRLSAARGDVLELRVSDDGPGLSAASAEALFLPWHRGPDDPPTGGLGRGVLEFGVPGGGGAGLGLSIARGITAAHGGTVTVEPAAVGTTFLVRLPVEPPDATGGAWEPVEVDLD